MFISRFLRYDLPEPTFGVVTMRKYIMFMSFLTVLLASSSCGVRSADQEGEPLSGVKTQNTRVLAGTLRDSSGAPLSGVTVIEQSSGRQTETDRNGYCEVQVPASQSRVELIVLAPLNTSTVLLDNIPSNVSFLRYSVRVSGERTVVREYDYQSNVNRFEEEGGDREEGDNDNEGEKGVSNRAPSNNSGSSNSSSQNNSGRNPGNSNNNNNNNSGGGNRQTSTPAQCLTCHGDRGGPRCSSSRWRGIHTFYNCGGGSSRKKKNKKRVLFNAAFSMAQSIN
ncbi:MAG: hypothetical protein D6719_13655 [Candidatus Dadabacteria bacterium]|nr:MAG: hypothetical protein D6719_13655 [Candidatus Dadabacteria bacterium]